MPEADHHLRTLPSVHCGVVTVSDTRTHQTDRGGTQIVDRLTAAGHRVIAHEIVHDEIDAIRHQVQRLCNSGCNAIILTGGTGISTRDVTFEAVLPLLDKKLDGFAELFRQLSYEEIGPKAMLSRALAGILGKTIVFSLPGSPGAVQLAMDRLILPVLPHVASLLQS